ncbi:IS1595 family transposase [Rhodopila sp.]|uniref:IS1595 family transposase n=1 Tax=Rhodopila sp. TaxID=2480087 RepID=UPI003D10C016
MTDLTDPMFNDDDTARAHFESVLWPHGPVCPHCRATKGLTRLQGKSHRPGLFQCNACRGHFTVTNGSIMERSHVPLCKWALAFHLMASSKKGISAHQLHRMLKVNYRTAWFMEHRIRECMDHIKDTTPMGGPGGIVEIDETFIGKKEGFEAKRGYAHKHAVMTLIERRADGGRSRSFHVAGTAAADLLPIIKAHVNSGSHIMTDEAGQYANLGKHFAGDDYTTHSKGEYVRDGYIHTNTAEGFYSVFKRGMQGVYQHCGEQHLHRYVAEFDFRYNNRVKLGVDDTERTFRAIRGAKGKRLMYQQPTS